MSGGIRGRCWPAVWIAVLSLGVYTCASSRVLAQENAAAPIDTNISPAAPQPPMTIMPPYMPPPQLVHPGLAIPTTGAVLIMSHDGSTPIVSVASLATATSPGLLVMGNLSPIVAGYWVWKPLAELAPGTYQVRLTSPTTKAILAPQSSTFEAVVEPFAPPEVTSSLTLSNGTYPTSTDCCHGLAGGFGDTIATCFDTAIGYNAQLTAGLTLVSPAAVGNTQYLFAMRPEGSTQAPDQAPGWRPWALGQGPLQFTEQADEYCFELLALDVNTQAVHRYDDLEPRCAPHANLKPLGEQMATVQDAQLDHLICPLPPDSLADRWCELNAPACGDDDTALNCGGYGHVCRGEPLPPPPSMLGTGGGAGFGFGGMGGTGEAGAGGGLAGMSALPSAGMGEEGNGGSFGCSVSTRSTRSTRAPFLLTTLALALALASARRTRRKR